MSQSVNRSAISRKAYLLASVVLLGTSFAAYSAPALAQEAAEAEEEEQIITVIARKQSERLQDVPVTVQAVTAETLDNYAIDRFEDIAARVPSLNVNTGGSGSGGSISLRGIGSSPLSAAFDSAVAFDIDGVQVSTMRLVQSGFMDLSQIDVLKGPQSLFFGKSASGGVVSLRSADPTRSLTIGGKVSYEFEKKGYIGQGFISGPISDSLGFRIASRYSKAKQNFINYAPGSANGPNLGEKTFDIRGTLAFEPTTAFKANLKIAYSKFDDDGPSSNLDIFCGVNGVADPVNLLSGGLPIPSGYNCDFNDGRIYQPGIATVVGSGPPQPAKGLRPFNTSETFFGRLKFDVDLTDQFTLSSVSGYLDLDATEADAFSYGGLAAFPFPPIPGNNTFFGTPVGQGAGFGAAIANNTLKQYTQELRLASNLDGPFNFMVGGFYEWRKFGFLTSQGAVGAPVLGQILVLGGQLPAFLVGPNGRDLATGFTYDWTKDHITKTNAYSLFASATYDLTDQLELSGGLRWTKEDKINTIRIPYMHNVLALLGFAPSGFFSGPITFNDSNVSPEVALRYKASDDLSIYAAYKTGFKSGGIDNSALPSNSLLGFSSPNPAVVQATGDALKYKSETSKGGEVGIKSQLADRALTLNASAFYYVFKDLQVQTFNSVTVQFNTSNAGELTSKGIDVDMSYRMNDILTLSSSVVYSRTKFTDTFIPDPVSFPLVDLEGFPSRVAPKLVANFAADARVPLGGMSLGLGANAKYSSSYFVNDTARTDLTRTYKQPSYWTVDASASIGDIDDKWRLSLIAVNIGNERYANFGGLRPFANDDQVLYQNRGRQIFVEGSFKF
jgi:iron complex outermembrane recepter protein